MGRQEASIAWEKRMAGIRAKRHAAESQARWAKWGAANSVATGHSARAGRADSDGEPLTSKSDNASAAARAARRSGFPYIYAGGALSLLWDCCWHCSLTALRV